jgi:hypothetical protein
MVFLGLKRLALSKTVHIHTRNISCNLSIRIRNADMRVEPKPYINRKEKSRMFPDSTGRRSCSRTAKMAPKKRKEKFFKNSCFLLPDVLFDDPRLLLMIAQHGDNFRN